MHLTSTDYVLWVAGTLLRLGLCALLLRHRIYRQLPLFASFIFLATGRTLLLWWIYHDPSLGQEMILNIFWVSQLVQVTARGLAAAEICWITLREYRGVWALAWRLLAGVAAILTSVAALVVLENPYFISPVVLRAERGIEMTTASLLVVLLSLCRYYGIEMARSTKFLAFGLGLHAVIQTINNSFVYAWLESYTVWWGMLRTLSFDVALLIWCWGLRKPILVEQHAPELMEASVYEQVAPQVNFRLRQLNERLLEMLK